MGPTDPPPTVRDFALGALPISEANRQSPTHYPGRLSRCSEGITWVEAGERQHAKALELYLRATQISPLDPWAADTYLGIAMQHLFARRFQEAESWADKALNEKPDHLPALATKAAAMAEAGFPAEEFHDVAQKIFTLRPSASIAKTRERMRHFREVDVEVFVTGLRKAGVPE